MRFVFVDNIPGSTTPARVYRSTGVVLINTSRFNDLPDFTKKFVLKHEEGHYELNTSDEFAADEYASNQLLLSEPGSLKNSIEALDKVLPKTTPEQRKRITEQVKRALKADAALGNKEAEEALKTLNDMNNFEGSPIPDFTATYSMNTYFPSVGNRFKDIRLADQPEPNAFLKKSQLEATGFTNPTFVKSINHTDNSAPVYEGGKVQEVIELLQEKRNEVLNTGAEQKIDASIAQNPVSDQTNIQVRVSNPLFYYILGVITVLVLALIINLFKD